MVDKVVIVGVRRGGEPVPSSEIQQSIGRAGRGEKKGEAIIVCPPEDIEYANECLVSKPSNVVSRMGNVEEAAFHLLPFMDIVHDEEGFIQWYGRSLAHEEGMDVHWRDVFDFLLSNGCIDREGSITQFGRISISTYFRPDVLMDVDERLMNLSIDEICDFAALSYCMAPCVSPCVICGEISDMADEYFHEVRRCGYSLEEGDRASGFSAYCALTKRMLKPIRHFVSQTRKDLGRVFMALKRLAGVHGDTVRHERLIVSEYMARHCVSIDAATAGVSFDLKKREAVEMAELGIISYEDLNSVDSDAILRFSDNLRLALQANGFLDTELTGEEDGGDEHE